MQKCVNVFRARDSLGGHPLSSKCEADSDGGQETLRHVGHDDTDQEDDGIEPVVAKDEGDDEEGHTEEDCDRGDDVDEVFNFFGNRGLSTLETGGKTGNPAHHSVVSDVDHHSNTGALHCICREETNVLRFQGILHRKDQNQLLTVTWPLHHCWNNSFIQCNSFGETNLMSEFWAPCLGFRLSGE